MHCDPQIRCVIPPWGGETAIDLVDLLDCEALAAAEPTWLVGGTIRKCREEGRSHAFPQNKALEGPS